MIDNSCVVFKKRVKAPRYILLVDLTLFGEEVRRIRRIKSSLVLLFCSCTVQLWPMRDQNIASMHKKRYRPPFTKEQTNGPQ